MRLRLLLTAFFILFLTVVTTTTIFATAKSDYEQQFSQYRQSYIEYSVLKNDFLENPTLDNQQKAVLAAKDTIKARDLAKANYAMYLTDLIQEKNSGYAAIKPISDSLISAKNFYFAEAKKSQAIVTAADLKNFTENYTQNVIIHDQSFRTGVTAVKISQLVRFQIDSKNALDVILPKLSKPFSTSLATRIEDLQSQGNKINDSINDLTNKLFSEEDTNNIDSESYFSNKSETIKKIQSLQLRWVDGLIDIDLNYAHI